MIVVESSAIIAIFRREDDAEHYAQHIALSTRPASGSNPGKGTGHGAALNYGDCFAYGLAKAMDAPLLCKGKDFPLTDINIA